MRRVACCFLLLVASLSWIVPLPSAAAGPPTQDPTTPQVLLRDDFDDPGSGWEMAEGAFGSAGYAEGAYVVEAQPDNWVWGRSFHDFGDVAIEVEASQLQGPDNGDNSYGIVCRYVDEGNFYALLISGAGSYGILRVLDGQGDLILSPGQSPVIRQGNSTNVIRAVCSGAYLALYANGRLLGATSDDALASGDIGLIVATFQGRSTRVAFDDLVVSEPQPGKRDASKAMSSQADADALLGECSARYDRSDLGGALAACDAARQRYWEIEDWMGEAQAALQSGLCSHALSRYKDALASYEHALALSQEIGDLHGVATAYNGIGGTYEAWSEDDQALAYYERALEIRQEIGDRRGQAATLNNIGGVRHRRSDHEGALSIYGRALAIWEEAGDTKGRATTLNNMGEVYRALSDYPHALDYYRLALPLMRELGDRYGEAGILDNIGGVYHSQSNYGEALDHYERALEIRQEIGDRRGEATTLSNIGGLYAARSDYRMALTYYMRALEIVQEIGDRAGEARTLIDVGEVRYGLSEYEEALGVQQRALAICREINFQRGESAALNDIGVVRVARSEYDAALAAFEEALQIRQAIGDRNGEATTLNGIGTVWYLLSNYQRALEYYREALAIAQEVGDRVGEAATLANVGIVYLTLSDDEEALATLERVLAIQAQIGNRAGEASALDSIGRVHLAIQDYERALQALGESLSIRQEIGDRAGQATTLNNIGSVYRELSWPERALDYYQEALPLRREVGDRAGEATTLNNIGTAYLSLAEPEHALASLQEALSIWRKVGHAHGEASTLSNVAEAYRARGEDERALAAYQQSLNILRVSGVRADLAAVLDNLGQLYLDEGMSEQAADHLAEALAIRREIGDQVGQATTLGNLAVLEIQQGEEEQATAHVLEAVDLLESVHAGLKVETMHSAFAERTNAYYAAAVHLLLAQGREEEAFYFAERARARTLLDLLGNQRVHPKASEDVALIEREAQQRGELAALEIRLREEWSKPAGERSQAAIEQIAERLEMLRAEYSAFLTELQLANPEYAALVSVDVLTVGETQALLRERAPETTLISYLVGESELTLFVVEAERYHVETVPVTREMLRGQAQALLAQLKADPLLPEGWQVPARALYDWLVAPVEEHLPRADRKQPRKLAMVPHDVLHYLPYGLLFDGRHMLLEGYALLYVPSASSLPYILDKGSAQAETLLALAHPDAPGAPQLDSAVDEVERVAALYGTQPLLGEEATESRLKAEAGGYDLLHVAAHSDYRLANPLFSAILLQGGGGEDGRLEVHEVFDLILPETDLVVLSACETHLAALSAGDELVGLERAFLRAGAPSLVTTLWAVDDASTAALMVRFYTHLRAGVGKAEALRMAQLETQAERAEPYYWAGFVLVGDAGSERSAPQRWPLWAGLGSAVACGAVAAAWWWRKRARAMPDALLPNPPQEPS